MDSLVSTEWLAGELHANDLAVIDATWHLSGAARDAQAEYRDRHIPGARFFDLTRLVDETSEVPQALPRAEQLAAELAHCGAGRTSRIVFYDDSAIRTSARAWFLCHAHGIENVAILDGGLTKWRTEGRALESGVAPIRHVKHFGLPEPERIRFKKDLLANIESEIAQVLDARDAGRFSGAAIDEIHGQPTGHIPGSRNLPFATLFSADGTYKPLNELRQALAEAGVTHEKPVIATCGSGITACVLLFAIHLTGCDDTALYDGSWLDWSSDPSTPKSMANE